MEFSKKIFFFFFDQRKVLYLILLLYSDHNEDIYTRITRWKKDIGYLMPVYVYMYCAKRIMMMIIMIGWGFLFGFVRMSESFCWLVRLFRCVLNFRILNFFFFFFFFWRLTPTIILQDLRFSRWNLCIFPS